MSDLPTITEAMNALSRVRNNPKGLTSSECQPLFAVLRASYDDELEDQYEALADQYTDATEDADDLQQDTVIAITHLPCGVAEELVPDLIRFLDTDSQFYELAHALVAIAFPVTKSAAVVANDLRQSVLAAIHASEDIWELDSSFADQLRQRGLPESRPNIKRLLCKSG